MAKSNPTKQIEQAANDAVHTIALAADAASKVIATAAAEALRSANAKNSDGVNDHDLIITLDTKMDSLKEDIKTLNDGTTRTLSDHETRLKLVETGITKLMAYGTVLVFLVGVAEVLLSRYFN